MSNKSHFVLICIGIVLFIASFARGQEVNRLQYYSAFEAHNLIYDMGRQSTPLSPQRPPGVELPNFRNDRPLFGRWITPRVKEGHLWIALDRSLKDGPYDRMFIDTNGDGSIKDETVVTAYQADRTSAKLGPVKINFPGGAEPFIYHLNFETISRGGGDELRIYSGSWCEGTLKFGEENIHCVLIDRNMNGTFNDKSIDSQQCDWIRIGKNTSFVGNYLQVKGEYYEPEVAPDGTHIKLTKADDLTFGDVGLPETLTELVAGGENGLFTIKPEKGGAKLPVGKYRILRWIIIQKDDQGIPWELEGAIHSERGDFTVSEHRAANLRIGAQIVPDLKISKDGASYYLFELGLLYRLAWSIKLTRDDVEPRPPVPRLRIKNEDGSYNQTFIFRYG